MGKKTSEIGIGKNTAIFLTPSSIPVRSKVSNLQLSKDPATDHVTSVCSKGSNDVLSLQHSQESAERESLFWALSVDLFDSLLNVRIFNDLSTFLFLTCA